MRAPVYLAGGARRGSLLALALAGGARRGSLLALALPARGADRSWPWPCRRAFV